ncbi:MAG: PLP-dependent aminotransferase family protein, partial [Actinobacteria bacterium]|nr:PLP-dependent aminotransferase family protein [Actinomycetota bacterium]
MPQSTPESTAELVERLLSRSAKTATSSVIRDLLQHANRPDVISLAGGIPAPELFPLERLANAATSAISELGAEATQYGLTEGVTELRELLAAEASVEAPVTPSQVVVTTGSQQAIDLIGRVLIDEGDTIVTDDPA